MRLAQTLLYYNEPISQSVIHMDQSTLQMSKSCCDPFGLEHKHNEQQDAQAGSVTHKAGNDHEPVGAAVLACTPSLNA